MYQKQFKYRSSLFIFSEFLRGSLLCIAAIIDERVDCILHCEQNGAEQIASIVISWITSELAIPNQNGISDGLSFDWSSQKTCNRVSSFTALSSTIALSTQRRLSPSTIEIEDNVSAVILSNGCIFSMDRISYRIVILVIIIFSDSKKTLKAIYFLDNDIKHQKIYRVSDE